MPKRIPVQGVIVQRDGKSFMPKLGEPFEFTQAELDEIAEINPGAVKRVEIPADDSDYVDANQGGEKEPTDPKAAAIAAAKAKAAAQQPGGNNGDGDL
jgi:hypothetical protein